MKALVAMSGGVDSAVAAKLTKEAGFETIGCTMRLFDNADAGVASRTCCTLDDAEDARGVAVRLGIPHYVFNFTADFRREVIGRFAESYRAGLTPNPCIDCNRRLKFGRLFERARVLGCDYVVTGHYARVEKEGDRYLLKKAVDPAKDQSYVLYAMTQEQLAHVRFPLGTLTKPEVRAMAAAAGFANAKKPDSEDICFAPDGDYAAAIERYDGQATLPGNFVDAAGNVLGRHAGIIRYTVGQHKHLGLGLPQKLFVLAIRPAENEVVLGDAEGLYSREVCVPRFHWIAGEAPAAPVRGSVKLRYRQTEQPAVVTPAGEGVHILFDEPQRAVTPGQAAVLYAGDVVLGGGEIALFSTR